MKEVRATNSVCAQPSIMQCQGNSGLWHTWNGSAMIALVIAPSVVGPAASVTIKEHEINRNQECRRRSRQDATKATTCTTAYETAIHAKMASHIAQNSLNWQLTSNFNAETTLQLCTVGAIASV